MYSVLHCVLQCMLRCVLQCMLRRVLQCMLQCALQYDYQRGEKYMLLWVHNSHVRALQRVAASCSELQRVAII